MRHAPLSPWSFAWNFRFVSVEDYLNICSLQLTAGGAKVFANHPLSAGTYGAASVLTIKLTYQSLVCGLYFRQII
jgi:hypothetical protein